VRLNLDFFAFYEIRDEGGDTPTSTGGILAIFEVPFISTYETFLIGFKVSFLEAKSYWLDIVFCSLNIGEMFVKAVYIPLYYLVHICVVYWEHVLGY